LIIFHLRYLYGGAYTRRRFHSLLYTKEYFTEIYMYLRYFLAVWRGEGGNFLDLTRTWTAEKTRFNGMVHEAMRVRRYE